VDLYSFDFRLGHIAKHVQLPPLPALGDQSHLPREQRLPPLLIVNIQLPEYPVRFHGFDTHTSSRIFTVPRGRRVRCSSINSQLPDDPVRGRSCISLSWARGPIVSRAVHQALVIAALQQQSRAGR